MFFIANALVVIGCGLQIAALLVLRRLIAQLPSGHIRYYWYGLGALIFLFLAGYVAYAVLYWNSQSSMASLVVPVIFFLGACFVFAVTTLSLRTTLDVRRVAVLELENITDPLMAIHNRRYLERRLDEEVARANRYKLSLSLLMVDVDHFKNINDTFGHAVGDLVLTGLGKLIADACRDSDIAARYGGEEIVIIAPNTKASTAILLAERLRLAVEAAVLLPASAHPAGAPTNVTVSVGVADLADPVRDVAGLLASADKAVYRAKREGRNRVISSEPRVA